MMKRNDSNYKFYLPEDISSILYQKIKKVGEYEWNKRKKEEKRKEWNYISEEFFKNPALIFGKMIPYAYNDKYGEDEKENKERYLELVANEMQRLNEELKITEKIISRIGSTIKAMNLDFEHFEATMSWRMVIGLGASHPQETSMTLHHIYGIPYIPGSAIKGVTKHWAVLKFADKNKKDNQKFEESIKTVADALEKGNDLNIEVNKITFKDLIEIFGTQNQEGRVIFFDAYPVGNINLKIDITNPHYPRYYSGELPPADWQSPTPIKFLTIEKTMFQFYLGCKKDKDLLRKALCWLKKALGNSGIGAKTSLGYGYFEISQSPCSSLQEGK